MNLRRRARPAEATRSRDEIHHPQRNSNEQPKCQRVVTANRLIEQTRRRWAPEAWTRRAGPRSTGGRFRCAGRRPGMSRGVERGAARPARLLVKDVLQLGEERRVERERLGDHLVELLGGRRIQRELGLLRFGQEGLVLQRLLKGPAQDEDPVLWPARRQR